MEHSTKWSNGQIFLAVHMSKVDAQSSASSIGIESKTTAKNHRSTKPIDKWTRNRLHQHRAQDHSQKPHVTKNHKADHTRTTQDPQRPKTRKVACRAGFTMIRPTKTTKTTKTTKPCGSSRACGYLGGYSLYFYIILYIYKSKCE